MRKSNRLIDLTGKIAGNWMVIERDTKNHKGNSAYWVCRCKCGNEKALRSDVIRKHLPKSCGCANFRVSTGDKIGHLTVVGRDNKPIRNRSRSVFWICQCSCGKQISISSAALKYGCNRSCGCKMNRVGTEHPCFAGYKELPKSIIARAKSGARIRNLVFDVSAKYLYELYIKQNKCCILSGLPIVFGNKSRDKTKAIECTASLDRIDSTKGYIKGNVQWMHKTVNLMKNKLDQAYFIDMCVHISNKCN